MNFWDITFLIILAIFTVKGYFKGLIWEVLRIAGLVIAYLFPISFMGILKSASIFWFFTFNVEIVWLFFAFYYNICGYCSYILYA